MPLNDDLINGTLVTCKRQTFGYGNNFVSTMEHQYSRDEFHNGESHGDFQNIHTRPGREVKDAMALLR